MRRRLPIILWVYLVGVAIFELLLLWNAYDNGGFQRHHTLTEWAVTAGFHITFSLLWPIVIVVLALQYFGLLPETLAF